MFDIRYERVYMGRVDANAMPPADLLNAAEQNAPMLHPERTHVLVCSDANRRFLKFGNDIPSSIGWRVIFTPRPTEG